MLEDGSLLQGLQTMQSHISIWRLSLSPNIYKVFLLMYSVPIAKIKTRDGIQVEQHKSIM